MNAEVIEPAQSEWASSVLLVPKTDGSRRFCIVFRKTNAVEIKDTYRIPRVDASIDSLEGAKVFTALDANCGY